MPKRKTGLNAKEKKFVRLYAKEWNGAKAYREAFPNTKHEYSNIYANKLLKKPLIQEELKEVVETTLGPLEKDLSENVKFWVKMRDDPEAKEASRLKASEMLAKYRGLFTDKSEVNVTGTVNILDDI